MSKLISKAKHSQLLTAAKKAAVKKKDKLASAKAPVSVWVLLELGVPVSAEAKAKWEEVKKEQRGKGTSANVVHVVPMLEYINALKAYEPVENVVDELFKEFFEPAAEAAGPSKKGK